MPPSPYPCLSPPRGCGPHSSDSTTTVTASSNLRTYPRVYSYTKLEGCYCHWFGGGWARGVVVVAAAVTKITTVLTTSTTVRGWWWWWIEWWEYGVCCDKVGVWRSGEKWTSKMSWKMRRRWKTVKVAVFHLRPVFQSFLTLFLHYFSKKLRLRNKRENGEKWLPWATLMLLSVPPGFTYFLTSVDYVRHHFCFRSYLCSDRIDTTN